MIPPGGIGILTIVVLEYFCYTVDYYINNCDGKEIDFEPTQRSSVMSTLRDRFEKSTMYKRLLKHHSLDEVGVWLTAPLADGTSASYFSGRLDDVIDLVMEMPEFWDGDECGWIELVRIVTVEDAVTALINERLAGRERLQAEIDKIDDEIKRRGLSKDTKEVA